MTTNGHVIADQHSRVMKARKIEALIGGRVDSLDLLDLGAGSGVLSDYFHARGAKVIPADRDDGAYRGALALTLIEGEILPFGDARFDVVIFNHVIEHVGDIMTQQTILAEIRRILKPKGLLYLAVPNKWALIEPHFRLPLLGAMPRKLANIVVRTTGKGLNYDCYPLSRSTLLTMLRREFPVVNDRSQDAAAWVIEHEMGGAMRAVLKFVPRVLLNCLRPAYPTLIMLCQSGGGKGAKYSDDD
ncbi:bifunctional 2-polyprenyl-6-hydroxyphenol methylase/3-demethylubiquinol 3-O-methyltransferase UbiG [Sphingopyxis sp.]|uniref:class I SAM-dependent methyltransferase n=1 Tax=Sphingopyxis sp. TaxID=1908224 RepID=UPI001D55FDD8|nr:class I SAM-dependent methyltransferase [Sphingopyxis sp.]MBW8297009.1 class I SAM-dependent methyltransferase [Sphingopyxis sp.]